MTGHDESDAGHGSHLDLRLLPAALTAWACALLVTLAPATAWPFAGALGAVAVVGLAWIAVPTWRDRARGRAGALARGPDGVRARRRRFEPVVVQACWCLALAALVACSGAAQWEAARGPVVEAAIERAGAVEIRAVVTGLVPDAAIVASGASGDR
ncbi:MAG: hypothetical protein ACTH31_12350, partial [Pseudoclavibacter sp.]